MYRKMEDIKLDEIGNATLSEVCIGVIVFIVLFGGVTSIIGYLMVKEIIPFNPYIIVIILWGAFLQWATPEIVKRGEKILKNEKDKR